MTLQKINEIICQSFGIEDGTLANPILEYEKMTSHKANDTLFTLPQNIASSASTTDQSPV
jgi:hypothetical protein